MTPFTAGQSWTCRAPVDGRRARIIIGAIVDFDGGRRIACCAVTGARQRRPEGAVEDVTVPFLPMTLEAPGATVVDLDGQATPPDEFVAGFEAWSRDSRGATYFTVSFEGSLERMIARQMAAIVGRAWGATGHSSTRGC